MPSTTPEMAPLLPTPQTSRFHSFPATNRPPRASRVAYIEGLVRSRELAMIVGGSNSGKSTLVIDLIQRAVRGMDWQGLQTSALGIFVCCAEAPEAFEATEQAWLRRHQLPASDRIFYMEHSFDLDLRNQVETFIAHVREQESLYGIKFDLIVFDTLADFLGGAEENSNSDLRSVNDALRRIADELDVAIILIHHFGKDEDRGPRGGTALNAKLDARFDVKSEGDLTRMSVGKLRRGPKGRRFTFRRESEIVGVDSFGKPETACVMIEQPDAAPAANAGNNLALTEALVGVVAAAKQPLDWSEVRKRLKGLGFAGNDKERKEAERLRDQLARIGHLTYRDGKVSAGPKMPPLAANENQPPAA